MLVRPRFETATSCSTNQRLSILLTERPLTHLDWLRNEMHDIEGQEKRRAEVKQFLSQYASCRPFSNSFKPLFQGEDTHANKTHFHKKAFALSLVFKARDFGTRISPIRKNAKTKAIKVSYRLSHAVAFGIQMVILLLLLL